MTSYTIGGHDFPPGANVSEADRIARLEDSVRAIASSLDTLSRGLESLVNETERAKRDFRR